MSADRVAAFVCPRGHRHYEGAAFCTVCGAGPVVERKRIYTLEQTVTERHFYNPDEIRREFGKPAEGESFEDFVIRVFERFDGSIYGDEFFPTDANPQVGVELHEGWDDE